MEKFFKLKENGTDVKTEILAGITTFFTMAYIIFVNPTILADAGMDKGAVMIATCIAAFIGTMLMGLLANLPFALAPGMGLNAYFAYTIVIQMGYSWQAALAAVFLSGIIFIALSVSGIREGIIKALPFTLKKAIGGGIGLFIALIGLLSTGIIVADPATTVAFGEFNQPVVILTLISLVITIVLVVKNVKGALLIGMIVATLLGYAAQAIGIDVGIAVTSSGSASLTPTLFKFVEGFGDLFNASQGFGVLLFSIISILISLTMVDMFDTIGTLIGAASKGNLLDKDGNLPNASKALLADAIATSVGAALGTSTTTTFVESSAGIAQGGKTGLTACTTAVLFLVSIFAAPLLGFIPSYATYMVLIVVGIMMMSPIKEIDWENLEEAIPAFFTLVIMPFAYSIADGIAFGCISYCIVKTACKKTKEIHPAMWIICVLFIIRYIIPYINIV